MMPGPSYQLLDEIGRGGMGVVYRAYDRGLDRMVAIKFLQGHLFSDEDFVQRFLREARTHAKVEHPNVVRVYNSGVDAGGRPYIVMELLEGESLRDRLRRSALSLDEAIRVELALLAALSATHAHQIVHRDIKPANIFLCADGAVKLIDFGVANSPCEINFTLVRMPVGTVDSMAPEQALAQAVDSRADIYAAGIVLFQMIAGFPPFRGESESAIVQQHLYATPPRLPHGPAWLDAVISRAMAKSPGDRFQSAEKMAEALRSGAAGVTRQGPPSDQRATWLAVAGVGTLLLLLLIVAAVGSVRPGTREAKELVADSGESTAVPQGSADVVDTAPKVAESEKPSPTSTAGDVPPRGQPPVTASPSPPAANAAGANRVARSAPNSPDPTEPPKGTPPLTLPPVGFQRFASNDYGFEIDYPYDWTKKFYTENGEDVYAFGDGIAELRIHIGRHYHQNLYEQLRGFEREYIASNYIYYTRLVGMKPMRFECRPAIFWKFELKTRKTVKDPWSNPLEKEDRFIMRGEQKFAFLLSEPSGTAPSRWPQLETTVKSFRFKDEVCTEEQN